MDENCIFCKQPLIAAETAVIAQRIAKAIEGPHLPVPEGSKYSLNNLREARWNMLTDHEKRSRLYEAKAVITLLSNGVICSACFGFNGAR